MFVLRSFRRAGHTSDDEWAFQPSSKACAEVRAQAKTHDRINECARQLVRASLRACMRERVRALHVDASVRARARSHTHARAY
eukprot:1708758-Alexandrium_andersonii.AAC.1